MKLKQNFKRVVSSVLCLSTLAMYIPTIPVYAEPNTEDSKEFQYTMFASSNEDGAIAVNASNFTINGQIATNGTIKCTGNTNIYYENSNNICVDMVYIPNKIDSDFFNGRKVDNVEDDYSVEEPNIDISEPLAVNGDTTMQGNVTIQAGVKSKGDINISGDVKNSYNTVIYSQYGDINIDCNNVSLNGLIYAPFGTIHINAINLNMNDTMIIANKIIIDAPNVNMNYSKHFGSYFSEVSDKMEIPEEDFGYLKDLNDNGIPDFFENSINWKYLEDTDGDGVPDIIEINTGTDPNVPDSDMNDIVGGITLEMLYKNPLVILDSETGKPMVYGDMNFDRTNPDYIPVLDAFDLVLMRQMYIEGGYADYADLDADGDLDADDLMWLESYLLSEVKSFPVYNNFDSDGDGLTDYVEVENYGTNPHKADTDGDGLNDYFEILLMKTNPLKADSILKEDPDEDGLTNEQEAKHNTDPYSKDTDGDGLTDSEEIKKETNPLLEDTDGDGLSDGDEVALGLDPNNSKSNGVELDSSRVLSQTISEDDPLLSEVNTEDNAYALSINIEASGNAKRLLNVEKSGYTNVMKDGSAVGFIPEFSYPNDYELTSITLNFRIKDEYKSSVMDIFAGDTYKIDNNDDISGINRFMIFKYFEEIDMQMPIEKVCNVNGDIVSVTLPKESFEVDYAEDLYYNIGSYALVDLEVWGMNMNNNLMPDEVIAAYNNQQVSQASTESETTENYGPNVLSESDIDIQSSVIDTSIERVLNVFNNYSRVNHSASLNNSFDVRLFNGHVYATVINNRLTWGMAKSLCEDMGGHLMTISSDAEFNALQYYLTPGNTYNAYWLGISCDKNDVWSQVSEDMYDSNKEANNDYISKISVMADGKYRNLKELRSIGYGNNFYYEDRSIYYPGSISYGELGYICEWNSYSDYLNYLRNSTKEFGKFYISSFSGTYSLKGEISPTSDIDTDRDGIRDYDEMNWKLLNTAYGEGTAQTEVSYVNTTNCLSSSSVHEKLVAEYSTTSKVNKVLNKIAGSTNLSEIASAASVEVNPVDGSSVSDDIDGDYIPDDEDGDRKKKFDPTPIIMDAIDDSDMIDEEGNTKISSKINDNHPKDTVMKSNTSRVVSLNTTGGGTNTLIDMGNDNTKVATKYERYNTPDTVQFVIKEDNNVSCIIAEMEFDSEFIRNAVYDDTDIVKY
ncbi:MAG: hypothetical protein K2K89_01530, partial [Ruminococcus sp.]|nr:hypothetical protein [Ruminococcus sp.]